MDFNNALRGGKLTKSVFGFNQVPIFSTPLIPRKRQDEGLPFSPRVRGNYMHGFVFGVEEGETGV